MAGRVSTEPALQAMARSRAAVALERPLPGLVTAVAGWRPPIRRREFWAVQALVVCIAAAHVLLEVEQVIPEAGTMYLVPVTLYFIPVVYAAVNFGAHGSGPTALWCALLAIPNIVLFHQGLERWGELWQTGTVVAIGFFVGHRVDLETTARRMAEDRARAHRAAEEKYRNVFEHVADPILLLDPDGRIEEANASAASLFGRSVSALSGVRLDELAATSRQQAASGAALPHVVQVDSAGDSRWLESLASQLRDGSGKPRVQLVLRDVTLRYRRERELEDYTRQTLLAREAERRRIARDLHDGPVQELVMLVRRLDGIAPFTAPEGSERLAATRELAKAVAAELRRFSRELRPSVLDDLGLTAAVKAEAEHFGRSSGLPVEFAAAGSGRRLEPDVELTFLRIEQEALNNVGRHAGASRVRIRLAFRTRSARLTVEDDGCGIAEIPPAHVLLERGKMGLVGMQERARLAGAALRIGPSRLGGTRVELTCPG